MFLKINIKLKFLELLKYYLYYFNIRVPILGINKDIIKIDYIYYIKKAY